MMRDSALPAIEKPRGLESCVRATLPTVIAHFVGCWLAAAAAAAAAAVSVRSLRVLMPTAFKFDSLWRASQP